MTTHLTTSLVKKVTHKNSKFDIYTELKAHAWHPEMTMMDAEAALANKAIYTYITRPREGERGFSISFVNRNGTVEHQYFSLIDDKHGIWRNCQPHHIGSLGKVVCDMMNCTLIDCKPLC